MAFNQYKYQNEFNKEAYDRVSINFPKGQKAIIEEHWRTLGYKSLNAYVNDLIRKDMEKTREGESNKTVNIGRDNNGIINM